MDDSSKTYPPVGPRPTQKTIAQITGLAVATVSRALSDAPDIGQHTKRRVREVAEEIGYSPDRAGVRLRTGKTNVISLLLSADQDVMNHTARLISSIASALRDTPYHMIITPYFLTEDPMIPIRYVVETRSADAVIINQTEPDDARVAYLLEEKFPFASHGRTNWCDEHAFFDFDNQAFARLAVQELALRGRRKILMILPPMHQNYARLLKRGGEEGARETQVEMRVHSGLTSDDPIVDMIAKTKEWLVRHPETDAIICASPNVGMASTIASEDLNRTIGQDIDIISKEAIPFLKQFRRSILTMQEDVAHAGQFLAKACIQRIQFPDRPPMQHIDTPKRLV